MSKYVNGVSLTAHRKADIKSIQVILMLISEAVSKKLIKICNEKKITINKLASISCLTQSTVDYLIKEKSKNPKLLTVARICDGLNISLTEFFDDELFNNIDTEDSVLRRE